MEIASSKKAQAMEKKDKICGQKISLETSTQKLLDEVLWSKDIAGKKSSPARKKK